MHIKVYGRVQGVGYRYFVEKHALQLNISGWVRNCSDGSVEIMADGSPEDLESFIDWCKKGPLFGSVSQIKPVIRSDYATQPVVQGQFRVLASV
ncbi:MAG: acylphosphatase [Alphaproteobacteria bacterium]|nr:acylphosphatase [Alphaproteobacteria bacterium]